MLSSQPVSPQPPSASSPPVGEDGGGHGSSAVHREGEVNLKDAWFADPIIGVDCVTVTEHGPGAHPATPLASPMHLQTHEHLRVVPLLVEDYYFIKFADERSQQPILVMRLYPYKRVAPRGCARRV